MKRLRQCSSWTAPPPYLVVVLVFDLGLGLLYVIGATLLYLKEVPLGPLFTLVNLGAEHNLTAWYASTKFSLIAVLLGLLAYHHFDRAQPRSWSLAALALFFLALSLDETAGIHEWLGRWGTRWLTGEAGAPSMLPYTGLWMVIVGLPGLGVMLFLIWSARGYFRRSPGARRRFLGGLGLLAGGALGVETLSNWTTVGSVGYVIEICVEEVLEMVGATIMLWATADLLAAERLHLSFERGGPFLIAAGQRQDGTPGERDA